MMDLRSVARALGGEVVGGQVTAPGPGHGPKDRSMTVRLSATAPDGFIAFSHAGDPWDTCRDHVRRLLGIGTAPRRAAEARRPPPEPRLDHDNKSKAQWLWRSRLPIGGTVAELYLRKARGYAGVIPPTLAFLPARKDHPPALIAAFGLCSEPEPGELAIAEADVRAVQLIKLAPDGSGKADCEPNKNSSQPPALPWPMRTAGP